MDQHVSRLQDMLRSERAKVSRSVFHQCTKTFYIYDTSLFKSPSSALSVQPSAAANQPAGGRAQASRAAQQQTEREAVAADGQTGRQRAL